MDQILFLHQPIQEIIEWNKNELYKVNKKLGEMTKVFKGFINPKKGGKNCSAKVSKKEKNWEKKYMPF